jgi:hypothetical protein
MIDVAVSVALALVLAILGVRLGRVCGDGYLWMAYGFTAVLSGTVGLLVQKVLPRWLILKDDNRTLAAAWGFVQETWHSWWSPQIGEQWVVGLLVFLGLSSVLLGGWQRYLRTVVGGLVVGLIFVGLGCFLFQRMLADTSYMLPSKTQLAKFAHVLVPALVLGLPWLGLWQRYRRLGATSAESNDDHQATAGRGSSVHLLAVWALTLSGTLLLATSGTLSLAMQLFVFSMLPMGWMIEIWLPYPGRRRPLSQDAVGTVAAWLSASAGLLVVLGYLFAEVSLSLGLLYAVSLWWVPWLWPLANETSLRKWGFAILAAAPGLIAAGISLGAMVAQHG